MYRTLSLLVLISFSDMIFGAADKPLFSVKIEESDESKYGMVNSNVSCHDSASCRVVSQEWFGVEANCSAKKIATLSDETLIKEAIDLALARLYWMRKEEVSRFVDAQLINSLSIFNNAIRKIIDPTLISGYVYVLSHQKRLPKLHVAKEAEGILPRHYTYVLGQPEQELVVLRVVKGQEDSLPTRVERVMVGDPETKVVMPMGSVLTVTK